MSSSSRRSPSATGAEFLSFRCTGCGNCCKEPLLPITDADVRRITRRTGDPASELVRWVDADGIDMDDEPEAFVRLRQGKRVMVLRQERGVTSPIYLFSSLDPAELAERAASARVDGYISKQHGMPHVVSRVREILG